MRHVPSVGLMSCPIPIRQSANPPIGNGYFRVDMGTLNLVGPAPLYQERTCVSGQAATAASHAGIGHISVISFYFMFYCYFTV